MKRKSRSPRVHKAKAGPRKQPPSRTPQQRKRSAAYRAKDHNRRIRRSDDVVPLLEVLTSNEPVVADPATNCREKLADRLRKARDTGVDNAPHVIVIARAGTGKTTTLVEGLKRVKGIESALTPSPQQAAVWEAMEQSRGRVQTICFAAFNRSIRDELKKRMPAGCDCYTFHGLGLKSVTKALGNVQVNQYRVRDILARLLNCDSRVMMRREPTLVKAVEDLVGLCKMNLSDDYAGLASHYNVELNGDRERVFRLVPQVLEACKDPRADGCIDYDDMVWLPIVLDLPVYRYDMLLVDEAQDLNRCQHALIKKTGRRLVLCGDPRQAIYGFAGADADSMPRLERELSATDRGCVALPLTVTRRCGKAIVKEAQQYVPEFEAHESNPPGTITVARMRKFRETGQMEDPQDAETYHDRVAFGDMVLCRCNAPLVSECFRFLKAGRKAQIQGRDVATSLVRTIRKALRLKPEDELSAYDVPALVQAVSDYIYAERRTEEAKRNPSEGRLMNLQDRLDCILAFCEGGSTARDVVNRIEQVFTDETAGDGIRLSSVHKAKGLEAKRVFLLRPEEAPFPHPMAKSAWAREQEYNLLYVAITRAIEELVYVS